MLKSACVVAFATLLVNGAALEPDSHRGAELFRTQFCTNCHAVKGAGAVAAPDLGVRLDRNYTPAGIASVMWNHAPVMWKAITLDKLPMPSLDASQAADLFAFFYSARYFEKPGEAERGKRAFDIKCGECHGLRVIAQSVGPPVEKWEELSQPVELVSRMWNHATNMQTAATARNMRLPALTRAELNDMLVYLQNLPQLKNLPLEFSLPSPQGGAELFTKYGCSSCHANQAAFERQLGDATLTDIAASMWNHSAEMREPHPVIRAADMRAVISYVWGQQFFIAKGEPLSGKRVFESKKCGACHNDKSSGAAALTHPSEPYSAVSMVSVLWKHGPRMMREMQESNTRWPELSPTEMNNVIAYLNSRRTP